MIDTSSLNYNQAGNTGWFGADSPWNYSVGSSGDSETAGGFNQWNWDSYASNPEFLKLIGFDGPTFMAGNTGDSGGGQGDYFLNPEFLEKANQFELRKMGGENWNGELSSVFRDGKEVSPSLRQFRSYSEGPEWDLAMALTAAAIAPGGFAVGANSGIGAGLGLSGTSALAANAGFNSAMMAAGSGAEDRDIGRAALTSGGAAFLPNMGQYVGLENPYLQQAFNGAVGGAAVAGLNEGDEKLGALMGAVPGLASYAGGRFMDNSYVPTSSGQNLINETNMASRLPRGGLSSFVDTPQMSQGLSYVPQSSPLAFTNSPSERSGFEMPDLGDFFGRLVPNSPEQWGSLAEGLGGMLLGGMQYRRARRMEKEMGGRRGAYETNLRRNLTRKDAASGRRSNYAGRETQLQAALAELDSRNAPAMMNLNSQQFAGLADMFRSGLRYAGKQGMFGERFTPGYREPSSLPPSSYLTSTIPMTQDVNNFDQFIGSTNDPTRRRPFRLGGM